MGNTQKIIYGNVRIPDKKENKDPKKYHYTTRRAEILRLIKIVGSPGMISPTQLGQKYGVTHSQICHDMVVLKKEIVERVSQDIKLKTELTFNKVVSDLLKGSNKDKYNAAKLMKYWNDWLFDLGVQQKSPQRIELEDVNTLTVEDFALAYDDHKKQLAEEAASKKDKPSEVEEENVE